MKTIFNKLLFFLLLLPFGALAQGTVSGVVTEKATGQPLPGVNIVVQGTTNGTATDIDGNFKLTNLSSGNVLVFSFIGFGETKVTYTGQPTITVALSEDSSVLQEVVVQVGYGGVKKKDITGAVSKVTAENLNQGTLTDPLQALQGKAAGVTITKQGGNPNDGFNVRIRGAAGFAAGGGPLYVVDGVRGVDPTTIAPEDILSYDILKDAASTAVYGADGANGVIFITTKKGKSGKPTIEFNTYIATDEVARKMDLVSADRYREFVSANGIAFTDNGGNTDWQDEIFRTGISKNYTFAVSGGSDTHNYRASVSHMDFEGVIKGSEKQRTVGRINFTQKAFDDKLTIDMGLSQTLEQNDYVNYGSNGQFDVLFQSYQRLPTDPVYNPNGSLFESNSTFNYYNPLFSLNRIQNERDAKRFAGNLSLDYEFIKGLNLKVIGSYLRNDSESIYFEPSYTNNYAGSEPFLFHRGYGKRSYENWKQSMLEATLTYKKTFGESHNFTALLGYSYRDTAWDGFSAQGRMPLSNLIGADDLQQFTEIVFGDSDSNRGERKDIGMFARLMYDYDSKYYVTGMIRKDGSSIFGPNNRWGYFPSVQVAWNVANESFIADNIPTLNLFKLRASYGISGNSNIGANLWQRRVGYVGNQTLDPVTGLPTPTLGYYNNENLDLQWDENKELNVGLDFALFNNRITGSVEWYKKNLDNLLIAMDNIPIETNFSNVTYLNGGEIENRGFEVTLNAHIVKSENFNWNTTLTYSKNTMELKSLGNDRYNYAFVDVGFVSGPGLVGVDTQRMQVGSKLGTFFGFEYAGFADGQLLIRGNDGELHYLQDVTNSDDHKKVLGNALPDFEMGWSNYFQYKNWDLSMAFRAVVGHEIYNATNMVFGNPNWVGSRSVNNEALILKENGLSGALNTTDFYLEDGSFIRLDNVNFGYNFRNPSFAKSISNIRVYASANNVLTLTKYGGVDPEVNFSGGNGSNQIYFGLDQYNIYPRTRTFTFGVNVTF